MRGYLSRMRAYLGEMFPTFSTLSAAGLAYAGIAAFGRFAHGVETPLFSLHLLVGGWAMFDLMLILRLMDEIKDEEIDRKLFPDRPLPSGRVLRSDLWISLAAAMGLYLGVNAFAGVAFAGAVALLAYAWLMFRRFFVPDLLKRSLPITLATHNPIVPLMLLHGFAVFLVMNGVGLDRIRWTQVLLYTGMVWASFLAWEFSRKIRSPEEEDEYVTYSRLLGRPGAVAVTGGVQAVGLGIGIYLWASLSLSWAYPALLASGWLVNVLAFGRFLRHPGPRTSKLKPFAQLYIVVVLLAQVLEFAVLR